MEGFPSSTEPGNNDGCHRSRSSQMGWKKQEATNRIKDAIRSCESVSVTDLVRETDLTALPLTTAYRVKGAHIYVDIVNAARLLDSDDSESERSHKRFLRFL